ncbi:MAG: glucose 1-dehydrogenase [Chloroflexi bacterium]|nr:glucose 1-dehydrogenase [Chloroflexota bacterium]
MRLENKVAIVTGGAAGIGRAICELFAQEGAKIVVADIEVDGGEETTRMIRESRGESLFVRTDVSVESDVQAMVEATKAAYGTVDVLVNDAAAFVFGEVQNITDADWQRVFGVNVIGQAYCVKHVLPVMKEAGGGAIVNIASVSGYIAQPAFIPYNASKGAVMQLTRCLALDLAPYNIRVNCVCPGSVLTQATELHRKFVGEDRETFLAEAANSNFMKRNADPREIACGALFLASDEASFVTGTPLVMDGGGTA